MYRLSPKEADAFPLEDYWGGGLCVIEWADRIRHRWPQEMLELHLEATRPDVRRLTIVDPPEAWRLRLRPLSGS
jgi:tRNA A37 threonylcarbamoyladenosine biosynthesis protein TsaE